MMLIGVIGSAADFSILEKSCHFPSPPHDEFGFFYFPVCALPLHNTSSSWWRIGNLALLSSW
jgi:hypothetical protein